MGGRGFDLTFPREALENLKPILEELGFIITSVETMDPITYSRKTSVTALRRGTKVIYLIHLGQEIANLESPSDEDLRALAYLEYCLPKGGTLVIMSERLNSLSGEIDRLLDIWRGRQVEVRFISWRLIDSLPPPGVDGRAQELARVLDVEMPRPPRDELSEKSLDETLMPNDVEDIASIMVRLASAHLAGGPEQFFKNLIMQTKLPPRWREEALVGWQRGVNLKSFAKALIQWAISKGEFTPEGETGEAAVLAEIIEALMTECGNNQRKQLLKIAERNKLLDELTPRRKAN